MAHPTPAGPCEDWYDEPWGAATAQADAKDAGSAMIVGIDLGTTNSLVSILRDGGPVALANELGEELTPSAVAFAEDGLLLVGRPARDRLVHDPKSGCAFFKRDMGTERRYVFGKRKLTPVECSAAILRELKRIAEIHLGETVRQAVISVPAYFHDTQRQATVSAANIAGLEVARVINEPTAAALAYGHRHPDQETQLMVFDLGGGTFDVTVLNVFENVIEVLASAGDSALGGEDYTDELLKVILEKRGGSLDASGKARLRQTIELAKRGLAEHESVERDGVSISRADLASAGRHLTARLRPIVMRCLRDAKTDVSELVDCLLVGGATRMSLVDTLLRETIVVPINRSVDPDRVVAYGAAIQAAAISKNEAVRDLILTDVCPHTLGTEISKQFGKDSIQDGFFEPIIDRNVTVPVSRAVTLSTMHARQDKVTINVFQGESRFVKENTFLGAFEIKGLRHRPSQKHPGEFEVRYSYDMNGILEVEVNVLESGKKYKKVIESRPGELTPAEVEAAVRRLQPLKILPRDLLPNRARIERANRLFAELAGTQRQELTHRLDAFEAALESQDGERIRIATSILDEFVEPLFDAEAESRPETK